MGDAGAETVGLRRVRESDLEIFYEHQREPEAVAMALFPARERDAFLRHWRTVTLARPDAKAVTITCGDAVAGNIGSWEQDGRVLLGYWLGRAYWGRGIATAALRTYLDEHEPRRPIHAQVVATNLGSIRVLEKCGFELRERETEFNETFGIDVDELLMTRTR